LDRKKWYKWIPVIERTSGSVASHTGIFKSSWFDFRAERDFSPAETEAILSLQYFDLVSRLKLRDKPRPFDTRDRAELVVRPATGLP
jgi:hypothetical protein